MSERETYFLELIHEHEARLRRISRLYAPDAEAASDLYQDMLVQLWRTLPTFRGEARPGTWLYRVALNTALDAVRRTRVRRRSHEGEVEALRAQPLPGPDERIEREQATSRLYEAIGRLDEIDRALVLLFLDERSYEEIADVLGMTVSNVGVRLHRAKKNLSRWLEHAA